MAIRNKPKKKVKIGTTGALTIMFVKNAALAGALGV